MSFQVHFRQFSKPNTQSKQITICPETQFSFANFLKFFPLFIQGRSIYDHIWTTIFILPASLGFLRPFSFRILFYLQGCQQTRSHHSALQSNTTLMIKTKSALSLTFVRIIPFFLSESPTMHSFCPRNFAFTIVFQCSWDRWIFATVLKNKILCKFGVKKCSMEHSN